MFCFRIVKVVWNVFIREINELSFDVSGRVIFKSVN